MAVPLVAGGVAGALIFSLWTRLGLPATGAPGDAPFPGLWRWFFAVWLPALFVAYSLIQALLARAARAGALAAGPVRAALGWDRWSYAGLPLFVLVMVGWRRLGDWRLALPALFLGLLFAKTLVLVLTLYHGYALAPTTDDAPADLPPGPQFLFLAGLLVYGFLAPYVVTAVSTAGDEQVYLLNTHSLYVDGDVDIRNNVARRDYATFYWGRPARWEASFVGFPALLLPGYALGTTLFPHYPLASRLGATLTISFFAALLGLQVYRLCRELGASRPAAFWAWAIVALMPPVLVNSTHVYPEIPAAVAVLMGVRALLKLPERTWPALLVVVAAVFMVLLKDRYTPLGLGVLLWSLTRLAPRRVWMTLLLVVGLGTVGLWLLRGNPVPQLFPNLGSLTQLQGILLAWNWWMPQAALGLFADQEFGLLYYGPHWTLAVVGLALFWQRQRGVTIALVGLVLFYVLVVVKFRWMQWDAGWTPPPRFILAAALLLAPFIAEAFDRCRGGLLAAVNTLWLVWSGALAFCLSLVPFWRYNNLDGRSTILQLAGEQLGLDVARFLPSLRAPTTWTYIVLAVGGFLLVVACGYCARRRAAPVNGWGVGAVVLPPRTAAGLVATVGLVWLAGAALVPTWVLEAEAMQHSAGIQFGSYQNQDILWVMTQDGEIWERVVTWPSLTEITIVAAGYTTTGVAPRMTLFLDGTPVRMWTLRAGPERWVRDEYVAHVRTAFGRPTLRLQFRDTLDHRVAHQVQHAYVDRILLRRINESR